MVNLVSIKTKQRIAAAQAATRSGAQIVPPIIREAGTLAVESYLCFLASMKPSMLGAVNAATRGFFRWTEDAGLALSEIRPGHVNEFFARSAWRNDTIIVYFLAIKRLFRHLEADRIVEESPFTGIRNPAGGRAWAKKRLCAFLRDLDFYDESDDYYRPGLVAMYPIVIGGQDVREIAGVTGLPLDEVEGYADRLRKNEIWVNGKVRVEYDIENPDPVEFVVQMTLIIGCAAGDFEARFVEDGTVTA